MKKKLDFNAKVGEFVKKHREEFKKFELEFSIEQEKYKTLISKNHDFIGALLKYHLITEYYINEYLIHIFPEADWDGLELRYYQKLNMLPNSDARVKLFKPGLKKLNAIRNKFSHNLDAEVTWNDLNEMLQVLALFKKEVQYNSTEQVIADFTTLACTSLIVTSKETDELFKNFVHEVNFP